MSSSSDGTWNENGTWKWLGDSNSDSMEVINTRSVRSVLYFEYIEAKEMKCGHNVTWRSSLYESIKYSLSFFIVVRNNVILRL